MKNLILFLGDNYESMHKKPLAAVHVYDKYHSRTIRLEFYLQDCTVSEVADGYDFLINCAPQGISFRIEMRSAPDKLSFKIPYDTILEAQNYCWLLEGVEIMPEFGAQPYGVEGYLLWPNYSGVACKFNKTKSIEFRDIIYSADNRWENFTSMPIFGVVEKDKSFLCIITDGQFECELIHRLAIGVERLHSTTPLFRFRMDPRQKIERVDRQLKYMFFEGGADSFSDMAKAYRAHLIENRGLKPLKARTASNPILDYASKSQWLKIFCADKPPQYDGKGEYKVWTSFEEARTILSELKKRGIDKITCMLVGWGPEGHDGRLPDRLPPDDRLGGEAKMKELVNWGLKQGFQMVVHDTYTSSYIRASTFHDDEIMRNAYGFFRIGGVWGGGEEKCLKPEVALKYAKRDLRKIRDEIGLCGCYYLDAISLGLESDFTKDGVNPRSHYANGLLALIDYTKEIFGACQVENSLDYIFDSADATASVITDPYRIKNLDCNISRCVDMFLPFFQIAWHGIILYHHADLMQFVDKTGESPFKAILQEISWGALGRIEMTYNDSFACKGFLCINDKEILDKVGLQFDLLNKKAGYLQKEFIEDYHQIAGNAFLTTFSDGSKVFVDYGNLSCRIINGQGKVIADVCYCHIPEYVS